MRYKFPNHEAAETADFVLGNPEWPDVVAILNDTELIVLGLDDHPILAPQIVEICESEGGVRLPDRPGDI
jgi:hypothetical protein